MKKYITTKAFEEHLASMDPEGIGIDLGANIGEVTAMMAARLAKVFAFEPDPWTFERLKENTAHLSNVEVIHAAVSTSDGEIEIYRHRLFGADPLHGSVGTSTLAGHKAVDAQRSIRVPKVDFIRFLEELGQPVNLIKMDIEGAEVELLEALVESPALSRIECMYVETHEHMLPDLTERTSLLRARFARISKPVTDFDWV